MKRFLAGCTPIFFGLALVACGGGGSGGSPTILTAAVEGSGGTGNPTATVSQTFDGSSAKPAEPVPIDVRFDPASIVTSFTVGAEAGAPTVSLTAIASNLPSAPLSVFLVDEAGVLEPGPHPLQGASANVFVAVPPFLPALNSALTEGVHEGVLKIRFCTDSSCAVEYPVSAASVLPYTITVTGRV